MGRSECGSKVNITFSKHILIYYILGVHKESILKRRANTTEKEEKIYKAELK